MRALVHALRVTVLAIGLLALTAGPAAADAPGPTNYRSEILGLSPEVDEVRVEILGGDAFLQLEADGVQVVVPGYDGEELYLRYEPDGSVQVNRNAATYYQNEARYGVTQSTIPANTGPDVAPDWVTVSTSGSYAWHDHRIHWMSPSTLPGQVDPSAGEEQVAYVWPEPIMIRVDGEPVAVEGQLVWVPDASPLPAIVVGTLALGAVVLLGGRAPAATALTAAVAGGVLAGGVSLPAVLGLPAGVPAQPLLLVLPALAILVALAGWSVRDRSDFGVAVAGAGGVPLVIWSLTQIGALTAPIVPPAGVPDLLTRVSVAAALALGIGAIGTGVRGLLAPEPAPSDA